MNTIATHFNALQLNKYHDQCCNPFLGPHIKNKKNIIKKI